MSRSAPTRTRRWSGSGHIADGFLVHDRPIERHVDDSVAWVVAGAPRLLRRARGYAPLPVLLKDEAPTDSRRRRAPEEHRRLSVGRQVFISQHIGDLETPEALAAFERVIADFLRLYEVTPAGDRARPAPGLRVDAAGRRSERVDVR